MTAPSTPTRKIAEILHKLGPSTRQKIFDEAEKNGIRSNILAKQRLNWLRQKGVVEVKPDRNQQGKKKVFLWKLRTDRLNRVQSFKQNPLDITSPTSTTTTIVTTTSKQLHDE